MRVIDQAWVRGGTARMTADPTRSGASVNAGFGNTAGPDAILADPAAGQPFSEPLPEIPGYELTGVLGRGGMGVVYQARQRATNRTVAVKMLRLDAADGADACARFRSEAEATANLSHPNIVSVYEAGDAGGRAYLVCECVTGGSLAARLDGTPWAADRAARLLAPLARAAAAAHARGVIHRDIKPSNVLLTDDGTPKLADFGLVKRLGADSQTHTGAVLGTPSYMAPEQARGAKQVGPAADVYGLGAVLYELLSGHPPFKGANVVETLDQLRTCDPVPPRAFQPRLPRDVETICLTCLQKNPAKRYPSADALADDLERFLAGRPIWARPVGAAERTWKWIRRNPALSASAAGVALTLAVGIAVSTAFALAALREAERAAVNETVANQKAAEAATAALQAARDRDAARAAEQDSRRRMVRLHIMNGTRALEAGEAAAALLWFHQAWKLDRQDPEAEPSHRARLAGVLHGLPELVGVCFHRCQVTDAAFSPEGTRLLARSDGAEVYLWDYQRCRLAVPPLRCKGLVRHACWGPDGTTVATASADGLGAVWDARTGDRLHTLPHGSPVNWVAYHPQGDKLVTAAEDGSVRLWDAATGKLLDWPFPAGAAVDYVAFSGDGTRLVTAARDDTVRVWAFDPPRALSPPLPYQASTPTERYKFHYHRWPRFASDDRAVLSFKGDDLVVWPGAGTEFKTFNLGYTITEVHPIGGTDWVLATGNKYNRVAVVRLTDGKDVYVLSHPRQANIGAVSPDGKYLMTASSGGLIHLRLAAGGALVWPPQKCGDFASAVAVSPDGTRCLAAGQDGTVRVWKVEPQRIAIKPYAPDGRANNVTVTTPEGRSRTHSPDGQQVVEYGGQGPALLGSAAPGAATRPVEHPEPIEAVAFSDDGARFVVFGRDVVRVWDAKSGKPSGPLVRVSTEGRGIGIDRLGRLSANGSRVAVWDDERTVSVWDLLAGQRVFGPSQPAAGPRIFGPPESEGHITGLVLSADGRWLAAATDSSGALTVWEVDTGRTVHHTAKRFQGYAQGFAFAANGSRILLWASDNNARVYDTRTGAPIGPAINPPLSKDVFVRVHPYESAISADGRWLAFFESGLGAVRLYDARWADSLLRVPLPAELLSIPKGAKSPITRLWFSPDGSRLNLVAAGKPTTIVLPRFEVPTGMTEPLVRFLTGHHIDANDGIEFIDQLTFREDPDTYRRAVLAWKGLPDDPAAQPGRPHQ
jgi:WD40 repeat protein